MRAMILISFVISLFRAFVMLSSVCPRGDDIPLGCGFEASADGSSARGGE